jgi:glycosyltransferase involved in cell wall biosynthesis
VRGLAYDVVIPTHGRSPRLLDQTLGSVYAQTVAPRRVIVVVDGNALAGADLRERWPSVEVIDLDPALGAAAARQAGISAASAEWVCFVDDDDLWLSHKMAVTADYVAAHPECDALRAPYFVFSSPEDGAQMLSGQVVDVLGDNLDGLERDVRGMRPKNDFAYLDVHGDSLGLMLDRNRSVIGTTCVRRSVLTTIPEVPVGTHPGDDYLLACLVATRAEWHLIDEPLMMYRLHAGQDTRSLGLAAVVSVLRVRQEAWRLCGSWSDLSLSSYGKRYRKEFRSLIWPLLRAGRFVDAREALVVAFQLLPRVRDRALLLVPEPLAWRWHHRRGGVSHSRNTEVPA